MKKVSLLIVFLYFKPVFAQEEITVLLDWFINPDHGPIIIAQEKGYFAEKQLKVEISFLPCSSDCD